MTDFLFDVPKQDSPRMAWIKRYEIVTERNPDVAVGDEDEFGNEIHPWMCWQEGLSPFGMGGATEHEAIAAWARKHGKKLWNEQNQPE